MFDADREMESGSPDLCPCGAETEYHDCCGRFVELGQSPLLAEELMRSRFSAYCRGRIDYLVDTTHPDVCSARLRGEIKDTMEQIEWVALRVISTRQGRDGDKVGKVEFAADYRMNGEPGTHHERSRFRRYQGAWKYLDDRG